MAEASFDLGKSNPSSTFRTNAVTLQLVGCFLVVCVLSIICDAVIWAVGEWLIPFFHQTSVGSAVKWLHWFYAPLPIDDSWGPMYAALNWFGQHPQSSIYQQIFFTEHIKFQYPPTSLVPLEILRMMGEKPSYAVLNGFNCWIVLANVLATGAFAFAIAQRLPSYMAKRWQFAALAAFAACMYFPILKALIQGQVQVWINALFAFAALAWLFGRKQLSGALIAVICLLKPQFALFLLWGVLRREWRFIAGGCFVAVPGLAASVVIFGLHNHLDYIAVVRALSRTGEVFHANASFNGLLNRLFETGDPGEWQAHGFPPFNPFVYGGTVISSAILVAAALFLPPRISRPSDIFDFMSAALTFTLASPIAWEHHYGITPVIYVALTFVLLSQRYSLWRSTALALLAVSYLLTGHWLDGMATFAGVLILLMLTYVAGACASMSANAVTWRQRVSARE